MFNPLWVEGIMFLNARELDMLDIALNNPCDPIYKEAWLAGLV